MHVKKKHAKKDEPSHSVKQVLKQFEEAGPKPEKKSHNKAKKSNEKKSLAKKDPAMARGQTPSLDLFNDDHSVMPNFPVKQ